MRTQTGSDIKRTADLLRNGELVAIPTETVYGLAGNAFLEEALTKIFEVKSRPESDPLILHTHSAEIIRECTESFPPLAAQLFEKFSPGPLTLVLPKKQVISSLVTAGLQTVAFRIPDHPLTLELLKELDFPLAAPSANPFGYISPTTAEHVRKQLGDKIPYILDGGPCTVGVESTIAEVSDGKVNILREGGVTREDLQRVAGKDEVFVSSGSDITKAPGQMKSHYAPDKKVVTGNIADLLNDYNKHKAGIIAFQERESKYPEAIPKFFLSRKGDIAEAASNLFAAMHVMDSNPDIEIILAEEVPEKGIGRAINERLRKASAPREKQ